MDKLNQFCQVVVQSNDTQAFRQRLQSTRSLPAFTQSLQDQTIQEGEKFILQVKNKWSTKTTNNVV